MNVKNIVIGIAIIILTIFVTIYGINTFYPKPEYEDFCGDFKTQEVIDSEQRCGEINGKWESHNLEVAGEEVKGYCDRDYYCRQDYEDARENHSRNVFFIAVPLGILIIALGAFLFSLEAVGVGLMGGGVGTLLYGIGGYWKYGENWMRFVISLIGLIILIWLTYWFNKRIEKKKR